MELNVNSIDCRAYSTDRVTIADPVVVLSLVILGDKT